MKLKTTLFVIALAILTNELIGSSSLQLEKDNSDKQIQQIQIQIPQKKEKKPSNLLASLDQRLNGKCSPELNIINISRQSSDSSNAESDNEDSPVYRNRAGRKYSDSMFNLIPIDNKDNNTDIENQFNNQPITRHENIAKAFPEHTKNRNKDDKCKNRYTKYKDKNYQVVKAILTIADQVGAMGRDTTEQGKEAIAQGIKSIKTAGKALKVTFCNTITTVLALGIAITGVYLSTQNQKDQ
jgi:hypothetical protein